MWMLIRNPNGTHVLFKLEFRTFDIDQIKRSYRKLGGAVVAIYRRKHSEPVTYDNEGVLDSP